MPKAELHATPNLQAVLGANLRAYRRKLGLSQKQFSQLISKRQQDLSIIERGIGSVKLQTLEEIAACIQCHPSIILTEWEVTLRLIADLALVMKALLKQLPPAFDESRLISNALDQINALARGDVNTATQPNPEDAPIA